MIIRCDNYNIISLSGVPTWRKPLICCSRRVLTAEKLFLYLLDTIFRILLLVYKKYSVSSQLPASQQSP